MGKKKTSEAGSASPGPAYHGDSFNGPLSTRSCTDIVCCLLFLTCFSGMLAVGVFGYVKGDPDILFHPTDSKGNLCGYGNYSEQPVLFFFDLLNCTGSISKVPVCQTEQVCRSACPDSFWTWNALQAYEKGAPGDRKYRDSMICKYNVAPLTSDKTVKQLIDDGDCAPYYFPSKSAFGRCVLLDFAVSPNAGALNGSVGNATGKLETKEGQDVTYRGLAQSSIIVSTALELLGYGQQVLEDITDAKWYILSALGLAMLISFFWIIIMRWLAGLVVWLILICFVFLLGYASYYGFETHYKLKEDYGNKEFILTTDLSYYVTLPKAWLALSCSTSTFGLLVLLIILFLRKRISIAIALIKESSRAIGSMVFTLLWPMWPFLFQVALFAFWLTSGVFLLSVGRAPTGPSNGTTFIDISSGLMTTAATDYALYLQIFNIVMLFWVMNFILALGRMTLAGAFATYYWTSNKKNMPELPITYSCGRALRYHIGTLAFGSLIITIVQLIRIFLLYLEQKFKASKNRVAVFIVKCLECCFLCIEKFVKMINDNVYIMVALYGKNFCMSAKEALSLITRNAVRLVVVDNITDFLLFLGKITVVGAIGVTSFLFFDGQIPFTEGFIKDMSLTYSVAPVVIISMFTYIVASCFFSVYSVAVDTLFLCFLEDLERNDGSAERPYHMTKELMKILGKKNHEPEDSHPDTKYKDEKSMEMQEGREASKKNKAHK